MAKLTSRLLTEDEYLHYKDRIPQWDVEWWLENRKFVDIDGNIQDLHNDPDDFTEKHHIRRVIQANRADFQSLDHGSTVEVDGAKYIIIGENLAIKASCSTRYAAQVVKHGPYKSFRETEYRADPFTTSYQVHNADGSRENKEVIAEVFSGKSYKETVSKVTKEIEAEVKYIDVIDKLPIYYSMKGLEYAIGLTNTLVCKYTEKNIDDFVKLPIDAEFVVSTADSHLVIFIVYKYTDDHEIHFYIDSFVDPENKIRKNVENDDDFRNALKEIATQAEDSKKFFKYADDLFSCIR